MGTVDEKIKDKLFKYDLKNFDELDDKTVKRLKEVEDIFIETEKKSRLLYEELKDLKPNISMIIKCQNVSFSRKTIYNDPLLKNYIELSIKDIPDYFNEEKIIKFQQDLKDLKHQYDKVIDNIIDSYSMKNQIKILNDSVKNLISRCNTLQEIISEKDQEILKLKKRNAVISINKYKGK